MQPLCKEPGGNPTQLTVDVHTHFFNGTDLPVRPYMDLIVKNNLGQFGELAVLFGGILQEVVWSTVPDAAAERSQLRKLSSQQPICPADASAAGVQAAQQRAYAVARNELRRAAAQRRSRLTRAEVSFDENRGLRIVDTLPPTYTEFRNTLNKGSTTDSQPFDKTTHSVIDFVLEMFQYRFASYARYMDDFHQASGRRVDLAVAALVDYDWWLVAGAATPTSLPVQVGLMTDLVVATAGRLHYWVPFCPYRQAQYRAQANSTFSALQLAQDAVRHGGAMGVKIYPPMGFASLGNADLKPRPWPSAPWLSGLAHQDNFGQELDTSLRELYGWCVEEDVPILAHANTSSGPSQTFSDLAGPAYWRTALQSYPDLRVVFGHFGGAEDSQSFATAQAFIQLMSNTPGTLGARSSADVAYFSKALQNPQGLAQALLPLFSPRADPSAVLPHRLLFGSDWKMLLLEQHANRYLEEIDSVLTQMARPLPAGLGLPTLVADTLGHNAITALGLRLGDATRTRIGAFYAEKGIQQPLWMRTAVGSG